MRYNYGECETCARKWDQYCEKERRRRMNTNPEVEKFALDQIKSHYERMVKARPYFCDMLYWMGRDKAADNAIMKQRKNATKHAREDVCRHLSDCHLTSLNVLDKEIKEIKRSH